MSQNLDYRYSWKILIWIGEMGIGVYNVVCVLKAYKRGNNGTQNNEVSSKRSLFLFGSCFYK